MATSFALIITRLVARDFIIFHSNISRPIIPPLKKKHFFFIAFFNLSPIVISLLNLI
jgi:hypothetical protein